MLYLSLSPSLSILMRLSVTALLTNVANIAVYLLAKCQTSPPFLSVDINLARGYKVRRNWNKVTGTKCEDVRSVGGRGRSSSTIQVLNPVVVEHLVYRFYPVRAEHLDSGIQTLIIIRNERQRNGAFNVVADRLFKYYIQSIKHISIKAKSTIFIFIE